LDIIRVMNDKILRGAIYAVEIDGADGFGLDPRGT
jgi:hypothetical protein